MNKNIAIYLSVVAILISSCVLVFVLKKSNSKNAYIISGQVYEKYKGKIEIEKKFTQSQSMNKIFYDSLQVEIKFLKQKVDEGKLDKKVLDDKYYVYSKMFEDYKQGNEKEIGEYNKQIWNQINQYVKDYGKEKGYEFILGASGDGTIMYSNDANNITEDVIQYINNKYEGK